MKPYINDALIGNGRMLATLDKNGKLLRTYHPNIGSEQLLDHYRMGISFGDDSRTIDLFDGNNSTKQRYIEDTNVLETIIDLSHLGFFVTVNDYVKINEDVISRKISIQNLSDHEHRY